MPDISGARTDSSDGICFRFFRACATECATKCTFYVCGEMLLAGNLGKPDRRVQDDTTGRPYSDILVVAWMPDISGARGERVKQVHHIYNLVISCNARRSVYVSNHQDIQNGRQEFVAAFRIAYTTYGRASTQRSPASTGNPHAKHFVVNSSFQSATMKQKRDYCSVNEAGNESRYWFQGIEPTGFAVRQSFFEEERTVAEQFAAIRALEAFRVEVLSNRVQAVLKHRITARGDETFETVLAVELSLLLDEPDVLKGSTALRVHADKVFGTPDLSQSGDERPPDARSNKRHYFSLSRSSYTTRIRRGNQIQAQQHDNRRKPTIGTYFFRDRAQTRIGQL